MKHWRSERSRKLAVVPKIGHNGRWARFTGKKSTRVYAICFDLDQERLAQHYPGASPNNGYAEIRNILGKHGFHWQQGSVYFGDEHQTPVTCVLAVQAVQQNYPWFRHAVSDIRMLRIEENDDLSPALGEPDLLDLAGGAAAAAT
jgi:virulence-associated protein VapD